ncbi:MAG: hypothetical protein WDO19_05165 [Bacteroidota bacterium]
MNNYYYRVIKNGTARYLKSTGLCKSIKSYRMKPTNFRSLIIIIFLLSICFSCKKENAAGNTNNDIAETLPPVQTAVNAM